MRTTADHFTTAREAALATVRGLARTIADTFTALYPGATYLVLPWDEDDDVVAREHPGPGAPAACGWSRGTRRAVVHGPGTVMVPGPYVFLFFRYRPNDQAIKEKRGCESVPDPAGDLAVHVEVEDVLTGPDTAGVDGGTGGGARAGSAGCCCRGSGSETEETGGAEYDGCGTAHGRVLLESVGGWLSG